MGQFAPFLRTYFWAGIFLTLIKSKTYKNGTPVAACMAEQEGGDVPKVLPIQNKFFIIRKECPMKKIAAVLLASATMIFAAEIPEKVVAEFEAELSQEVIEQIEAAKAEAEARRAEIEELMNAKLEEAKVRMEELKAEAETRAEELLADLPEDVAARVEELKANLEELKASQKADLDALKAEWKVKIEELKAKKAELIEKGELIDWEAKAAEYKQNASDQVADYQAQVDEMIAKIEAARK